MRIAVIGGSTAGLATALRLQQSGHDVSIWERRAGGSTGGFGLLLTPTVRGALSTLGVELDGLGCPIETFDFRGQNNQTFLRRNLEGTIGIERAVLQEALNSSIPEPTIHCGKSFVGFEESKAGIAKAALFDDGSRFEADLFIGADGVRSQVRESWCPGPDLRPVKSVELVGIYRGELPEKVKNRFLKFGNSDQGLAIGLVPTSDRSLVWYIQCDPRRWPQSYSPANERTHWLQEMILDWPDVARDFISRSDLSQVHLWRTTDRDLPTSFHRENVLLVGDAAHPLLTFTSQGTGSALEDAVVIGEILDQYSYKDRTTHQVQEALAQFYRMRAPVLRSRIRMGRHLQDQFLHPTKGQRQLMPVCG